MKGLAVAVFLLTAGLFAPPAAADDSLLESFGKAAGLISPEPNPPDFVKATRPKAEPTSIPAFAAPAEPRSKVKTPAELRAMDADLERAARRQEGAGGADDADAAKGAKHASKSKYGQNAKP